MQVIDGVLSGGQMGGVWRSNGLAMAFSLIVTAVFEVGAAARRGLRGGCGRSSVYYDVGV